MAKKVNEETLVDVEVKEVKPNRKATVKRSAADKKEAVKAITEEVEAELNGETEIMTAPKTRLSDSGDIDISLIPLRKRHTTMRLPRFLMKMT